MRYWREVNNDDEQEEGEEVEKEEALPLEVKEEQEERQKEGDATLIALEMVGRAIIAGARHNPTA